MLSVFLTAVAIGTEFSAEPPLPLSPVTLAPPSPMKKVDPPYIFSTSVRLKGLDEDFRHRTLAALKDSKGIRYVELAPDGVVWGYTETGRWTALILPCKGECLLDLTYSSWSEIDNSFKDEIVKITQSIINGQLDLTLSLRAGQRDEKLEKQLPFLYWHVESRPVNSMTNNFRHFGNVAALFMEKYEYSTHVRQNTLDWASALGRKNCNSPRSMSASMLEQDKGKSVYFLFIGVAIDEETASKDVMIISKGLMKLLYE